ncbi:stage V sporulation protein T [Thermosediminibacter oceani]|uniref:Transcriptional regulator, AbrB family n=1 Tax=Thermosediminibacter oceani (strain ATCC BAA-1034 / DSM 16646 / JW/IW-1228P) TaxID=555079 RepID=D9RZJ3_THEOJ|nr:stage V sporulation protein T [Thermosediminibacter oceani]ADL06891.1 transcriptional regulator, AbrB family [Thermosediminibacter oceani DSM 16646]
MKATGIVRRIDDLGRVVIPKEIRRTLRIREGDPLEIFTDREGEVILKKYSPIGELAEFAKEYTEALHDSLGHIACIADRDAIIAVSGTPKKELMDKPLSSSMEAILEERKPVLIARTNEKEYVRITADDEDGKVRYTSQVIVPIIADGDPIGAVILLTKDPNVAMGELELKVAETAAGFLSRQMNIYQ